MQGSALARASACDVLLAGSKQPFIFGCARIVGVAHRRRRLQSLNVLERQVVFLGAGYHERLVPVIRPQCRVSRGCNVGGGGNDSTVCHDVDLAFNVSIAYALCTVECRLFCDVKFEDNAPYGIFVATSAFDVTLSRPSRLRLCHLRVWARKLPIATAVADGTRSRMRAVSMFEPYAKVRTRVHMGSVGLPANVRSHRHACGGTCYRTALAARPSGLRGYAATSTYSTRLAGCGMGVPSSRMPSR